MTDPKPRFGVIGGSGLYDLPGAKVVAEVDPETPWGKPSERVTLVELGDQVVAFLPRHGRGHRILPSEVNSRANLCALKVLGVEEVIAFSAVGSLKEERKPLDFSVPAQIIDRTRHRPDTYFGDGVVGHVAFADPFCSRAAAVLREVLKEDQADGAEAEETLVCMEGPLFSTRAESELYRALGAGLINMSALPEAKLAREAELCYALVCMVTDYDCWREEHDDVDIQMVLQNLMRNADHARSLLLKMLPRLAASERDCGCGRACENAIITAPEHRSAEASRRLRILLPRYFSEE